jgi:hypothetical protein
VCHTRLVESCSKLIYSSLEAIQCLPNPFYHPSYQGYSNDSRRSSNLSQSPYSFSCIESCTFPASFGEGSHRKTGTHHVIDRCCPCSSWWSHRSPRHYTFDSCYTHSWASRCRFTWRFWEEEVSCSKYPREPKSRSRQIATASICA